MHAVLRVDLELRAVGRVLQPFIDAGRAVALAEARIDVVLGRFLQPKVLHHEMHGLVLLVIGVGQEDRGELVEGEPAVGLRIGDRRKFLRRLRGAEVGLLVAHRPEQADSELLGPHGEPAEHDAEAGAISRPQRFHVAHRLEVAAHGGGAPGLLVG